MTALFDTNVVVAGVVETHPDHESAAAAVARHPEWLVAAHSLAEIFNTLTRPARYNWPPADALAVVEDLPRSATIIGLSAEDYLGAIRRFARSNGIGPRIYDFLIGTAAIHAGAETLVTLNSRDFRPLFPDLKILSPDQYLETL